MKQINETLYALNKDGSFQEWKVFVEDDVICVHFGKKDGKIQNKFTTCESKNVGRANEKTAEEQACLEAASKWEKQYRLGYRPTVEELSVDEQFSPMLAADAIKKRHMIDYPCYVQPKLDGLRCLVTFDENGEPIFNSRGNKVYPLHGEIVTQIKFLQQSTGYPMFDGEVYLHGLSLQKIISLTKKWRTHGDIEKELDKDLSADHKRRDKALADNKKEYKNFSGNFVSIDVIPERDDNRYGGYESADLQFHIFDIPNKDRVWFNSDTKDGRFVDLLESDVDIDDLSLTHLKAVFGEFKNTEQEVRDSIAFFMQDSYEGSIVRNFKGKYEFGQRSNDLLKWKLFQTDEAVVESVEEDKNLEGILHCKLKTGVKFKCKMKGTHAERSTSQMKKLISKFITFSYQTLTDDGVPQFPVSLYVRDVNPDTWEPLE